LSFFYTNEMFWIHQSCPNKRKESKKSMTFNSTTLSNEFITMSLSADECLNWEFCLEETQSNEWNEIEVSHHQIAGWNSRRVSKLRLSNTHREVHRQCNGTLKRKHKSKK
jgi:hypothetical protein